MIEAAHHIERLKWILESRSFGEESTAALTAAISALDREQWMGNLLAVIHRDGGHYLSRHGWQKTCEDAEAMVIELRRPDDE